MNTTVSKLLQILDLEPLENNLFRGHSLQVGWQRIFGGQVVAQALMAAMRTVPEERHAHSLHGYFLRPGDPSIPIVFEVDRIRDGGSFTTRRVVAIQRGEAIFSMSASFQILESGLEHQTDMPEVPAPDQLPSEAELKEKFFDHVPEPVRQYWERERPIEFRPVNLTRYLSLDPLPPHQNVWMRTISPLPNDTRIHQCVLAYMSDMFLLETSLLPHGKSVFDPNLQSASLDHAMWFQRPFKADDWLLYATTSPSSSSARGVSHGALFTQDGTMVASTAQEGLIRIAEKKKAVKPADS